MATAQHLTLVDTDTGLVHEGGCPACAGKDELLGIKQRKLDAAWREVARLQKDREEEHRNHPERELVEQLHTYWQQKTGHPRSRLDMGDGSRFEAYLKGLRNAKAVAKDLGLDVDAEALMRRAIDGAAYDPWKKTARNGHVERFDDPTTIFKNAKTFETFVNRAPRRAAAA